MIEICIGHIQAFVDRSQHIWPTDSLFPERKNCIIPLSKCQLGLDISMTLNQYMNNACGMKAAF